MCISSFFKLKLPRERERTSAHAERERPSEAAPEMGFEAVGSLVFFLAQAPSPHAHTERKIRERETVSCMVPLNACVWVFPQNRVCVGESDSVCVILW